MASAWIGVGFSKPSPCTAPSSDGLRPSVSKVAAAISSAVGLV